MNYAELPQIELNNYPILFQQNKLSSLTDRYQTVSTIDPINVLRELNWIPRQVIQLNPRKESKKGYQAHRVRLYNPSLPVVNGAFIELLLTNAYDGSKAFQLALGIFRMVCTNGLVAGDTYRTESVKHVGYTKDKIATSILSIAPQAEPIVKALDQWSHIDLSSDEQTAFATSALELRLDEEGKYSADNYAVRRILTPNRSADTGNDLWTTFNRVQENMLRTGFRVRNTDTLKSRQLRPVKAMDKSDKLNKALWSLTEKMAELKAA